MENPLQNNLNNAVPEAAPSPAGQPTSKYSSGDTSNNTFSKMVTGAKNFLATNNAIGNFAFLILVLFIFIFILQLAIGILGYFYTYDTNPKLLDGMMSGDHMMVIEQDPNITGSQPIFRSVNKDEGIEFSWNVWLYLNDNYDVSKHRHIFHKGTRSIDPISGLATGYNAPGLYLKPNTLDVSAGSVSDQRLLLKMDLHPKRGSTNISSTNQSIEIPNIPMHKWVNIIVICRGEHLDLYINGTITQRLTLKGVPKQNYSQVYVAANGGFSGNISNLWYYSYALSPREVGKIVKDGPNTKLVKSNVLGSKKYDYLSLSWYMGDSSLYKSETPVDDTVTGSGTGTVM